MIYTVVFDEVFDICKLVFPRKLTKHEVDLEEYQFAKQRNILACKFVPYVPQSFRNFNK